MNSLPSWLDAASEVPLPDPPARDDLAFVRRCHLALTAFPALTPWHRFQLLGVTCLETGWGKSRAVRRCNLAGMKAKRERVAAYAACTGRPQRWFRAPGHVASGDAPTVLYLAYDSEAQFWVLWLNEVLGSSADAPPWRERYREAARRFWAQDRTWIDALIDAGYRGDRTAGDPKRRAGAIATHASVVARAMRLAT
jgi:hypothetical protein